MSKAIRLSPSGPNITNGNGAPFAPGPGARLRLVEAASSGTQTVTAAPGAAIVDGTVAAAALVVALDKPLVGLEYRATIICDVENDSTNVTAVVQLYLDMSPDNATWTQVAANGHLVGFSSMRQVRCDLPLAFGSSLGVVAGQTNVFLRARIAKTAGAAITASAGGVTGPNIGATLLQLEECL